MYAARLWWLARWLGHAQVAVLDGGLPAWQRESLPLTDALPSPAPGDFTPGPALTRDIDAAALLAALGGPDLRVVDARAPERYRGDVEPMDPVAGHIPGALNRPFAANLRPDGRFKPGPVLRAEFDALLAQAGVGPEGLVHQCGSGVTACHNLLAAAVAGLPEARLYPGSWSEWCADPARPVATGPQP
jgi:thiosulfate/3-mercaptopyruvate sulfurtransferase